MRFYPDDRDADGRAAVQEVGEEVGEATLSSFPKQGQEEENPSPRWEQTENLSMQGEEVANPSPNQGLGVETPLPKQGHGEHLSVLGEVEEAKWVRVIDPPMASSEINLPMAVEAVTTGDWIAN